MSSSPTNIKNTVNRTPAIISNNGLSKTTSALFAADPTSLFESLDKRTHHEDFEPIDFLNQHYSTESILVAQLPSLREAVSNRVEKLDDRISDALQRQSETSESTRRHVQDAKSSVAELDRRIRLVKEKALQSEGAVLEITRDMKRLDCAKRHLQRTITTLKRLHMLTHGVEQLRLTVIEKPFPDYKTASHLVEATRLLLTHFEAYTSKVEPMKRLSQKVMDIQDELRSKLVRGFRIVAFGYDKTIELEHAGKRRTFKEAQQEEEEEEEESPPMPVDVLQGGAIFINSLGDEARTKFVHDFCQDHLASYVKDFEPPSREPKQEKRVSSFKVAELKPEADQPDAGLDRIEKRFLWFREILQEIDKNFPKVFPPEWNLQASMAGYFLQLTRDHILALLDGPRKDPDANNATILLKALQKTLVFEKEITAWLQRECSTVFKGDTSEDKATKGVEKEQQESKTQVAVDPLIGIASSSFENYMGPYIELESQSMDEQLTEALEDRTVDTRGERPVFISSTNLFVYIKGSIQRCTKLTKGRPFFLLHQAFKDAMRKYAQILEGKLPAHSAGTTGLVAVGAIASSFSGQKYDQSMGSYKIPKGEEVTVCRIINTCEYCADTLEALEDLIRDTIGESFKSKVDMLSDQEVFHDITAKAIRVLVSGLINRLEPALRALSSANWAAWDSVGEESAYVRLMHDEIEPFIISSRELLPTSYFRSFCDKFANGFTTEYYDTLIRLKRISEPGTQQLLLDVYNLKTLFLKLPILEEVGASGRKTTGTGSTIAPAMYTKMVQKQFGKIEILLKLVGTHTDMLVENFKNQWSTGTPADLQTIMTLKGLKRNDQIALLEKSGLDHASALRGATAGLTSASIVSERVQALQDQGTTVAAKVNSDLYQMRQKVDDFRKSLR